MPAEPSFRAARQTAKTEPLRLTPLHRRQREPSKAITFAPLAWLKLLMFLHAGDTEVGGFGISAEKRPLYIEDFVTVKQTVTAVTVAFDDTAVADYFDDCIDRGLSPSRFARIWLHTHPGASPEPSSVDEETFARVFGDCDWAVMLIVSRTQAKYARLSFNAGPGGSVLLPVNIDWAAWPELVLNHGAELSAICESWMDEYGKNICPAVCFSNRMPMLDPCFGRQLWADALWREDDLYERHEQKALDEEFADFFETAFMEDR
jgi:hypothetical protein